MILFSILLVSYFLIASLLDVVTGKSRSDIFQQTTTRKNPTKSSIEQEFNFILKKKYISDSEFRKSKHFPVGDFPPITNHTLEKVLKRKSGGYGYIFKNWEGKEVFKETPRKPPYHP
jgi:hypothetical protein